MRERGKEKDFWGSGPKNQALRLSLCKVPLVMSVDFLQPWAAHLSEASFPRKPCTGSSPHTVCCISTRKKPLTRPESRTGFSCCETPDGGFLWPVLVLSLSRGKQVCETRIWRPCTVSQAEQSGPAGGRAAGKTVTVTWTHREIPKSRTRKDMFKVPYFFCYTGL